MVYIDSVTKTLFYPFFRQVGNPYQKKIKNINEFRQFIIENNSINDCFVSVYSEYKTIDKLFFDLDIMDVELAGKFYKHLTEDIGLTVVPVFSGKKGFHFYVLLKPRKYKELDEAVAKIRRTSYSMMKSAGLYKNYEDKETGEKLKIPLLDTQIIGDLNRLTRVPNTLRPPDNLTYCTYLPTNFGEMTLQEIYIHAKSPHHDISYDLRKSHTLEDLPDDNSIYEFIQNSNYANAPYNNASSFRLENLDESIKTFLRLLLRPCLFNVIVMEEPPHDIRTATTIDLLNLDFSIDEIVSIYHRLKWDDFNEHLTKYHVGRIAQKGLNRFSCRELKNRGYCVQDCRKRVAAFTVRGA